MASVGRVTKAFKEHFVNIFPKLGIKPLFSNHFGYMISNIVENIMEKYNIIKV